MTEYLNDISKAEIFQQLKKDINKYLALNKLDDDFKKLPLYSEKELKENTFINETFFNAGTRSLDNNKLWLLLLRNIPNVQNDNLFLYGFVTLLLYRALENYDNRKFIISYAFNLYFSIDNSKLVNPVHSRWKVSAANVLSTVLLMQGNIQGARKVQEELLSLLQFIPHTPLFMMNLCLLQYQYALVCISNQDFNKALIHFDHCYLRAKEGISEIYHPRNDWFLGMHSDCQVLINISKNVMVAKSLIYKKTGVLEGSRFVKMNSTSSSKFDACLCLHRFSKLDDKLKSWHKSIENILNRL